MRSIRVIALLYMAFGMSTMLAVGQTAPNIENGLKSFGSYSGSDVDTVNLQSGNLMFHVPLFSYPQRGGKISLSYAFENSSKNWSVEQYQDSQHNTHSKWVLAEPASVYIGANVGLSVQRARIVNTDTTGNVTTTLEGYAVTTPDQAIHWLPENLANNNMVTVDNSGFQYTLTASAIADRSRDTAVVTDRQGSQYYFPRISHPTPPPGNSTPVGFPFTPQTTADGLNTINTINDSGIPLSVTDANGNVFSAIGSGGIFGPYYQVFPSQSGGPASSSVIPFPVGTPTATSDYSGCVTTRTISQAMILPFPGPDGRTSNVKVCASVFIPAASFSQPNVDPPNPNLPDASYLAAGYSYIVSAVMPDGNSWSFDYDGFGNLISVKLPTGGTITYQWQELSLPACAGNITQVSRAVYIRTVNDLVNPPQKWQYFWGTMQNGSLTNYVQDPNGNETAHVFTAPVSEANCQLYETETRYYQGTHGAGTLLKTVDTHYLGLFDWDDLPGPSQIQIAGHVVADTVTTKLPTGQVSEIVRQYDNYPNPTTFGEITDEKVYDYGSSPHGGLLRETVTTYQWQVNSAYLNSGLIDLPSSVIIKDGSGCSMAETDYTYDEPGYLTAYAGTLPAGTHGTAPGGTVRGNLTTVKRWAAPTSSCSPTSGTAITSHTNWYDTGEIYQQIDPLGHTTTYSYDPVYAGAFVTQTCSPTTNSGTVSHCISGTYDSTTGLLETLTNENATTQAIGNTPGDSAHTSNFTYDTSWRLIQAQAPPDPANGNARATTTFTPSAPNVFPISVQHQHSVTTVLTDTSTAYFDGLDRINKTAHALPNGTATVVTNFDGLGEATSVTNPYFTTSDPTYGVTFSQYDGLGRVTETTKQDSSVSSVKYDVPTSIVMNGDCTITKDEAGNQRGACTDALGRLVEVDEPNPGTTPTVSNYATMQTDGNFVLYNPTNTALWSSGTSGSNAGSVMMQDDGNLVLYIFKWSAGTYAAPSPGPFAPQSCSIGTYLAVGQSIHANQCIVSPHGQYMLYMDPNGNFYIYDIAHGTGTWGANTYGHPGAYALMQGDGNLVVYDANNNFLWMSGTNGTNAERLDMEDDGRIIIYKSAWNSGTSTGQFNWTQLAHPPCDVGTGTGTTGILGAGQCFVSPNGHFALFLQTDGNLVLYDESTTPITALWMTNTPISPVDPGVALRTLYTYDALGNLTCVEQHGGVTGTGCSSAAANDATSPWRVRRLSYDSLGRLLTAKNPESGTVSYSYDNDGNLLQKTSPAPNAPQGSTATQTISYCYDELHRVTGRAYGALSCPLTSPVVSYTYDSATNAKGKLVSMTDQAGMATYSYDVLGRMTSETRAISGVRKSMNYGYNLDGSISTLTYPSGAVITYSPDSAGRIVSAIDNAHGINYVTGATYGPDGSLTGFVNGSGGAVAITNAFTYNKRLQPITMSAATASQTLFSIGYDFHIGNGDNGNVYGITNYRDTTRNQSFAYDALNRLTSAQNAGTDCTVMTGDRKTKYWGNSYTYDAWGNLTNKAVTKCSADGLISASLLTNQLSGYSYDAAGNMTNDGIFTYTFDPENRLIGAHGYAYTYDGDGMRVEKTNGTTGTLYWYMAPGVMDETDLSGNNPHEYVFFGGQRVARKDSNGLVYYYFSDHLKTASVVTDSGGNLKADSDFYPWGGELQIYSNFNNTYKFTGKERDSETGLDYFGGRYNSSAVGRFMSADPLGGDKFDPQTLNKYSYVRNNPINRIDPTGLYTCKDQADCKSKLDIAFEKARQQDLKSKDADVRAAAQAYGDPTKDGPGGNKVDVSFADLSKEDHGGHTTSSLGGSSTGFIANSEVVIDSRISGSELDSAVGHEGSHVQDAQTLVGSIGQDSTGQFKVGQDITQYQSEKRAYGISDTILRSENATSKFECGVTPCVLGKGLKLPAQLPAEIDRLLFNNYKSDINKQPLTPTNQGASIVPH